VSIQGCPCAFATPSIRTSPGRIPTPARRCADHERGCLLQREALYHGRRRDACAAANALQQIRVAARRRSAPGRLHGLQLRAKVAPAVSAVGGNDEYCVVTARRNVFLLKLLVGRQGDGLQELGTVLGAEIRPVVKLRGHAVAAVDPQRRMVGPTWKFDNGVAGRHLPLVGGQPSGELLNREGFPFVDDGSSTACRRLVPVRVEA